MVETGFGKRMGLWLEKCLNGRDFIQFPLQKVKIWKFLERINLKFNYSE